MILYACGIIAATLTVGYVIARRRYPGFLFAAILCLAACGGGDQGASGGTGGASACALSACPSGAFPVCEPQDVTVACCNGGTALDACARPAGILTHDCAPTCASGECAKSPNGAETCCTFGATNDPCDKAVQ